MAAADSWGLGSSCDSPPSVSALLETGTACKEQGFHRMLRPEGAAVF